MQRRRVSKSEASIAARRPAAGPLFATPILIAACIAAAWPATRACAQAAAPTVVAPTVVANRSAQSVCPLIEDAARFNALPVDFLTRLIWRESRFQPDVIGPLTRGGDHALGIAQFMPQTAAERRLFEPFNPVEALAKSGELLAVLREEFGNLGLAAAAYNAGPRRVRDYLGRGRDLPLETRNYVLAITGRPVETWAKEIAADPGDSGATQPMNCENTAQMLARSVGSAEISERRVPGWCRALSHPNIGSCGPVHARAYVAAHLESAHNLTRSSLR